MQQTTSKQLYAYWDRVRNGRRAPQRFEIEPAKLAPLLPETFIAECAGSRDIRFRLAGTKICEQFGRELRGVEFLSLWQPGDQEALISLLRTVLTDAAVGEVVFQAYTEENRQAKFELVLMPLIHTGHTVNRLLGAISAIDPPFWLGASPLLRQEIIKFDLHWPDGAPAFIAACGTGRGRHATNAGGTGRERFRVYEGGLDKRKTAKDQIGPDWTPID
jgi:hypothetical protein